MHQRVPHFHRRFRGRAWMAWRAGSGEAMCSCAQGHGAFSVVLFHCYLYTCCHKVQIRAGVFVAPVLTTESHERY